MSVHELFDRAAERYDAARRQLLPCFDDLYGVALRLLPADRALPLRVLDIGAGTGLFAALIAEQYPRAELTLIDLAPDMLAKAGERMARYGPRVAIRQLDMLEIGQLGKFDAIVSALAIHHATDAQKQAIFRAIASMLPHLAETVSATPMPAEPASAPPAARNTPLGWTGERASDRRSSRNTRVIAGAVTVTLEIGRAHV